MQGFNANENFKTNVDGRILEHRREVKMIRFNDEPLQVINVNADEIIEWSEIKLKELLDFDFKVWCNPHVGKNYLYYNIDETEMSDEQWQTFSREFDTSDGYSDMNLKKLLVKIFGESEYIIKVTNYNEFYIIKHLKLN